MNNPGSYLQNLFRFCIGRKSTKKDGIKMFETLFSDLTTCGVFFSR
jgi:hypothetical protein